MCGFSALIYLCREGALRLQIRGNRARNAFLAPKLSSGEEKWKLSPGDSRGIRIQTTVRFACIERVRSGSGHTPCHPSPPRPPTPGLPRLLMGELDCFWGERGSKGVFKSGASPTRTLFIPSSQSPHSISVSLAKRICVLASPPLLPTHLRGIRYCALRALFPRPNHTGTFPPPYPRPQGVGDVLQLGSAGVPAHF